MVISESVNKENDMEIYKRIKEFFKNENLRAGAYYLSIIDTNGEYKRHRVKREVYLYVKQIELDMANMKLAEEIRMLKESRKWRLLQS